MGVNRLVGMGLNDYRVSLSQQSTYGRTHSACDAYYFDALKHNFSCIKLNVHISFCVCHEKKMLKIKVIKIGKEDRSRICT